ncbi:MAG: SDR family oxidoreductase [Clostridiales Family XIII bacterium]|nr:SDR family oxidoreductase [Clostridiales Family XIII bacterium]
MIKTAAIKSMEGAFSVAGKNVVVTGGATGIGYGIAAAFAQSAANVAILDIRDDREAAAADMRGCGVRSEAFECDISDIASVKAAVSAVYGFFDHVDVLVNNAGVGATTEFLADRDMGEWHRVIGINLQGAANMIHTVAPRMKAAGLGGEIISISSVGGQRILNLQNGHHTPSYSVAKAGIDHFTRYLAADLGAFGIRVNAIAPGPTHSNLDAELPPAAIASVEKDLPTHRFGEPIEIGALCVFLSSPAACQITGCVYAHDGGQLCVS